MQGVPLSKLQNSDFFSALSILLHDQTNGWSPALLHKKLILHFCQIVFSNASAHQSISAIIAARDQLKLNKTCVLHPAIKLWIQRVSAKEKHLLKTPADWFHAYPKLLKGMALRFVHYHRNYEAKPYRLFDWRVFCQLASEVFCCKIGLANSPPLRGGEFAVGEEPSFPPGRSPGGKDGVGKAPPPSALRADGGGGGGVLTNSPPLRGGEFVRGGELVTRWFYPLETADYYLKLDLPVITLKYLGKGRFLPLTESLLDSPENQDEEDTFELKLIKEELYSPPANMNPEFCLRRYTVEDLQNQKREHTNVPIGDFTAVAKNVHVIVFKPMPSAGECCYQVYPGNPKKTCYSLSAGQTLFVFSVNKRNQIKLCGETSEADVYLYFNLQPEEHVGVVAVVVSGAGGKREAEDAVLNNTKFILE